MDSISKEATNAALRAGNIQDPDKREAARIEALGWDIQLIRARTLDAKPEEIKRAQETILKLREGLRLYGDTGWKSTSEDPVSVAA